MSYKIQVCSSDAEFTTKMAFSLIELGYEVIDIGYPYVVDESAHLLICDSEKEVSESATNLPILETKAVQAISKEELKKQIDNLLSQIQNKSESSRTSKLSDRIFVRYKDKMVKLQIDQILYVEADRNYSRIFCIDKEYMVTITLKNMESKLPDSSFFRIHRSYLVNLNHIDEVAETHLVIARKALPVSKSLRSALLKRLQTI